MSAVLRLVTSSVLLVGALAAPGTTQDDPQLPPMDPETRAFIESLLAEIGGLRSEVADLRERVDAGDGLALALERIAEQGRPAPPAHGMDVYYKNGLHFDAADGSSSTKISGRIHYDITAGNNDSKLTQDIGDFDDGSEIRRSRLAISGKVWDKLEYKASYEFAGGDADFKDVYVRFKQVPYLQDLYVGQLKEPLGFDEWGSSNVRTFVEKNLPNEAFAPSRNVGVRTDGTAFDKNLGWSVAWVKDANDAGISDGGDGDNAVTGRIFGTPIYEDDGRRVLHLGAAASVRRPVDDMVRYRSRPEAHQSARFVDTGTFEADQVDVYALELAGIEGPFHYQAEWIRTENDTPDGDADFWGNSFQIGYFLTGEHRGYKRGAGKFDRVAILDPALREEPGWGRGAWEVALRKSHLDLDDGAIEGGELDDWTVGLNWYLDPLTRVMLDVIRADLDGSGESDIAVLRVQKEF